MFHEFGNSRVGTENSIFLLITYIFSIEKDALITKYTMGLYLHYNRKEKLVKLRANVWLNIVNADVKPLEIATIWAISCVRWFHHKDRKKGGGKASNRRGWPGCFYLWTWPKVWDFELIEKGPFETNVQGRVELGLTRKVRPRHGTKGGVELGLRRMSPTSTRPQGGGGCTNTCPPNTLWSKVGLHTKVTHPRRVDIFILEADFCVERPSLLPPPQFLPDQTLSSGEQNKCVTPPLTPFNHNIEFEIEKKNMYHL